MFDPKLMWILCYEIKNIVLKRTQFFTVILHCSISPLKRVSVIIDTTLVKCVFDWFIIFHCFQGGWTAEYIYYLFYRLKKNDVLTRISLHLESFHIFLFQEFIHLFVPKCLLTYLLCIEYKAENNISTHHSLMFLVILHQVLWIILVYSENYTIWFLSC